MEKAPERFSIDHKEKKSDEISAKYLNEMELENTVSEHLRRKAHDGIRDDNDSF